MFFFYPVKHFRPLLIQLTLTFSSLLLLLFLSSRCFSFPLFFSLLRFLFIHCSASFNFTLSSLCLSLPFISMVLSLFPSSLSFAFRYYLSFFLSWFFKLQYPAPFSFLLLPPLFSLSRSLSITFFLCINRLLFSLFPLLFFILFIGCCFFNPVFYSAACWYSL